MTWDNGAVVDAGAATWGSGTTGVTGVISAANSLVGSTANDQVGSGVTALSNGNYVVRSSQLGQRRHRQRGCGDLGQRHDRGDRGGLRRQQPGRLHRQRYRRRQWRDGAPERQLRGRAVATWDNGAVVNAGAATWGSGTTGVTGVGLRRQQPGRLHRQR